MGKLLIAGSEFSDTDLAFRVCSHLEPILEVLESSGNSYNHYDPLYRDKYSESKLILDRPINFDLIEQTFVIPPFIVLSRSKALVFCKRCWCSIVEKT